MTGINQITVTELEQLISKMTDGKGFNGWRGKLNPFKCHPLCIQKEYLIDAIVHEDIWRQMDNDMEVK